MATPYRLPKRQLDQQQGTPPGKTADPWKTIFVIIKFPKLFTCFWPSA
jgi:hypothetical protein